MFLSQLQFNFSIFTQKNSLTVTISTLGHLISVDLGTLGVGTSRKTNAFADRSREFLQRAFCVAKNDESGSFRSN